MSLQPIIVAIIAPRWSGEAGGKLMLAHIDALAKQLDTNPRLEILTNFAP